MTVAGAGKRAPYARSIGMDQFKRVQCKVREILRRTFSGTITGAVIQQFSQQIIW